MDLLCYLKPGWDPRVRPATQKRAWMDATQDSFAYRCLPLNIANSHGWEVLSPCGFDARWDGGAGAQAVTIRPDPDTPPHSVPVSLFGHGTITFHIDGVFRTPEGWNMWVGGSPNYHKDGIQALGGIIETDWSPYTFTMNWRFSRANHWVRFEKDEPIAFIFPVQRHAVETFEPKMVPMSEDPDLEARFDAWVASRDAFHHQMRTAPPSSSSQTWQKHYYRGNNPDGTPGTDDHQSKLKVRGFEAERGAKIGKCPMGHAAPRDSQLNIDSGKLALAKRNWMMEVHEFQRSLSLKARTIHRWEKIPREVFLDDYYATLRPVLLVGEMAEWPALAKWSPDYLKGTIGSVPVEFQGGRNDNPTFEIDKHVHRRTMPFDMLVDNMMAAGNDAYITARNGSANTEALAPLRKDIGRLDKLLNADTPHAGEMIWIGGAGTFTPVHHDLTNNLLAQLVGRKRIIMAPPSETPKLYNSTHVFSDVHDLSGDLSAYPEAANVRKFELILEPGDILYIPVGWWHQVQALDFSVSITFTNFLWPNHAHESFPE